LIPAAAAPAASSSEIEARLEGINQTVMDILRQLDALQQEIQQLRGEVELHSHTLEAIKARQREMFLDVEQRPPVGASVPPVTVSPSAAVAPPPPPVASRLPPAGEAEQSAYDKAFNLLRSGSYDDAIAAFRGFLQSYPEGALAANSQYWVGEAYYVTRRFKEALPEFQHVVDDYPGNAKIGDALLKIGYIHYELNETTEARKAMEEVIARFPQSTAAQLATTRLAKMKR
jgi:tol-pal system protein YbgF